MHSKLERFNVQDAADPFGPHGDISTIITSMRYKARSDENCLQLQHSDCIRLCRPAQKLPIELQYRSIEMKLIIERQRY